MSASQYLMFVASVLALSCNDPQTEPKVGSNSNWLRACQNASQCTEVNACTCGGCTLPCTVDTDCGRLSGARCALSATPASWAACQSSQPNLSGLCLPTCQPGTCDKTQACVDTFCSLLTLPSSSFCSAVTDWSQADRAHEDEILASLQQSRITGGVVCGSSAASAVLPALRLDARLTCAARVFAFDLGSTGSTSLTDSQGRNTQARISLAGYAQTYWGEGFARSSVSAANAYASMLGDNTVCPQLVGTNVVDVGIGVAGNVYVVTLAAP